MIEVFDTRVCGFDIAIRGMRNSYDSWANSDSKFYDVMAKIGDNDLALMKKLIAAGTEQRKFLRMINATMDIIAPLYWWKEFDTYKVATVRCSCSTMHTITRRPLTPHDFSYEQLTDEVVEYGGGDELHAPCSPADMLKEHIIPMLNICREKYEATKDKKYWQQIIQLLPSSYNQRSTVQLNYETLLNIYRQRKKHKLHEWVRFCDAIETFPFMRDFIAAMNGRCEQ